MKGGIYEEKVVTPMLPRLHVHDTEKGGPKAPPRNKMALYEQLSFPSQRFNSGSSSFWPLPFSKAGNFLPSPSLSQDVGHEGALFNQFTKSPAPSHLPAKFHPCSSVGASFSNLPENNESNSLTPTTYQSFNITDSSLSASKYNPFELNNFSNIKNSAFEKLSDEGTFTMQLLPEASLTYFSCTHQSNDRKKNSSSNLSPLKRLRTTHEKQMKGPDIIELKNKKGHIPAQGHHGPADRFVSATPTRDNVLVDASLSALTKVKSSASLKRKFASNIDQHRGNSPPAEMNTPHSLNLDEETSPDEIVLNNVSVKSAKATGNGTDTEIRTGLYTEPSLEGDKKSANGLNNVDKTSTVKECGSAQTGDSKRCEDILENPLADSFSALDILPNDVVGVMGEKQFWRIRRAIVNQQKIFAVQLFELYRLIKVQKRIAGSPHFLVEGNISLRKSPEISSQKKSPSENVLESQTLIDKPKNSSQRPNLTTNFSNEDSVKKLPLQSNKVVNHKRDYGLYSVPVPTASTSTSVKSSSWCYPPPVNQWLVPVMSPSEGLVYKPYSGPYPSQSSSCMVPVYGSCKPVNPAEGSKEYLGTIYGVPASHQGTGVLSGTLPLAQTCFPPYGFPIMNSSVSGSTVEQTCSFPKLQSNVCDIGIPIEDFNSTVPHHRSRRTLSRMSGAVSPKEGERQGSTPNSPCREKGDALLLFPVAPADQESNQDSETNRNEFQTQVIKVVPLDPRSATESAARIFQSIQEERNPL